MSKNDLPQRRVRTSLPGWEMNGAEAAYSIALVMSSTTFLASPNTIIVLSM